MQLTGSRTGRIAMSMLRLSRGIAVLNGRRRERMCTRPSGCRTSCVNKIGCPGQHLPGCRAAATGPARRAGQQHHLPMRPREALPLAAVTLRVPRLVLLGGFRWLSAVEAVKCSTWASRSIDDWAGPAGSGGPGWCPRVRPLFVDLVEPV